MHEKLFVSGFVGYLISTGAMSLKGFGKAAVRVSGACLMSLEEMDADDSGIGSTNLQTKIQYCTKAIPVD